MNKYNYRIILKGTLEGDHIESVREQIKKEVIEANLPPYKELEVHVDDFEFEKELAWKEVPKWKEEEE